MARSYFDELTNCYALQKTLRFELKPVGKTQELLDDDQWELFPRDKRIEEIYQNIVKPSLNQLHSRFIEAALEWAALSQLSDEVYAHFVEAKSTKNDKKYESDKKKLRKEVVQFLRSAKVDGIDGYKQLLWKKYFDILIDQYGDTIYETTDEHKSYECPDLLGKTYKDLMENYFKGFSTYLTGFHENRKHLYADDGKAGSIATRTIDENLTRFLENKYIYAEKISWHQVGFADTEVEVFDLNSFHDCLNQTGIDSYNETIGQLNSKINLYNQQHGLTGRDKLPKLQVLYKQILSDIGEVDLFSYIDQQIESYDDLQQYLKGFIEVEKEHTQLGVNLLHTVDRSDLTWVWLKGWSLKRLSNRYLQGWSVLSDLLPRKSKEETVVSLAEIETKLKGAELPVEEIFKAGLSVDAWAGAFATFIQLRQADLTTLEEKIGLMRAQVEDELMSDQFEKVLKSDDKDYSLADSDAEQVSAKGLLKAYLDAVLELDRLISLFVLETGRGENKKPIVVEHKDTEFYDHLDTYRLDYTPYKSYNGIRNFLTKKPYSTEKIKVNFENSTLFDGWDRNKERANYGVILKKQNDYYLAVLKSWNNSFFDESRNPNVYEWSGYEKMEYYFLPGAAKMIPKCSTQLKKVKEHFAQKAESYVIPAWYKVSSGATFESELPISKEVFDLNNITHDWNKKFQTSYLKESWDKPGYKIALTRWIDFCKSFLSVYPKTSIFDYKFKASNVYTQLDEFYEEVDQQSYEIKFVDIDEEIVDEAVKSGDLYLFQIYNKDFAPHKKGNDNLHTMYRKALFAPQNLENQAVYKLNGQAEIFFRPASIEVEKQKQLKTKQNQAAIHHKRFTRPKLFFHCPITINFARSDWKINDHVKTLITEHEDIKVIGIDRGEKHLLYFSLVDKDGQIVDDEIASLNTLTSILPDGGTHTVDYQEKLTKMWDDRDRARKERWTIETIKELKAGYLSHVIHKLCQLVVKYNAVIVLEDLNRGFKRWRQKIEKQVYQKFELALAQKLNHLVFKGNEWDQPGGVLHGYQLTPEVKNFQDIYRQTGVLFYTEASYTSTTCPQCGFRKHFSTAFKNMQQTQNFINQLDVQYDQSKDAWSIAYDLEDIKQSTTNKHGEQLHKTQRTLRTVGQQRLRYKRSPDNRGGEVVTYELWAFLTDLCQQYGIDVANFHQSLSEQKVDQGFYTSFMFFWSLLMQVRNSDGAHDIDYIQCPACGFHSDDGFQGCAFDGDACGAYNIARKWILLLEKIRNWEKLSISYNEWDNHVQI